MSTLGAVLYAVHDAGLQAYRHKHSLLDAMDTAGKGVWLWKGQEPPTAKPAG